MMYVKTPAPDASPGWRSARPDQERGQVSTKLLYLTALYRTPRTCQAWLRHLAVLLSERYLDHIRRVAGPPESGAGGGGAAVR